MQHYSSQAFTDIAKPAGGATITVKLAGTNTNATIYSDDGVTTKSNPFSADSLGHFDFYAASGKYDITITGTQLTTYTLPNQVVFDPFEQTAADTGMAVKSMTALSLSGPISGPVTATTISASGLISANAGLIVASGQLLTADQILPLNSSGVGGFWPVSIAMPSNYQSGGNMVNNSNDVWVYQFFLPFKVQIGKVSYRIANGVAASTGDLGIFDIFGNRLAYTGGFTTANSNTTSTTSLLGSPITLNAGFYYFAQTNSSNIVTIVAANIAGGPGSIVISGGSKTWGTAANASSGGVLPATLGTITSSTLANPAWVYFER
ncbi:MAG TPA: hypothetical protein VK738_13860 [Terriglobales bacterium]|jgi:hypothetical protein|nr:hypothetical protein [Terriglobales bacterium]